MNVRSMKARSKAGFTMAELLIVVAIIAVLVAIAIPVFNSQLEKSRESTDAANIRSAYAEMLVEILESPNTSYSRTVTLKQAQDGWQNDAASTNLGELSTSPTKSGDLSISFSGEPKANKSVRLDYTSGTSSSYPTLIISYIS